MDSNEEYLDQLLKSITDQESSASEARNKSSDPESRLDELLHEFPDQRTMPVQKTFTDVVQEKAEPEMPDELPQTTEPEMQDELLQKAEPEMQDELPQMTEPEMPDELPQTTEPGGPEDLMQMLSGEDSPIESMDSILPDEMEAGSDITPDLDAAMAMSQEEIERLLAANSADLPRDESPHFNMEQDDLSSLLQGLGEEEDEDVREISDLLNKADHDEPVDDAVAALLQGLNDDTIPDKSYDADELFHGDETEALPEKSSRRKKKERVKKERKPRKGRVRKESTEIAGSDAEGNVEETNAETEVEIKGVILQQNEELDAIREKPAKKTGFWGRLINALTEEDEEDNEPEKLISEENDAILQQMELEELNKIREKGDKKAGKKKKDKKKGKEQGDEVVEGKPDKKKKEKKPKREKKIKPASTVEETPGKKLPMKKVIPIFLAAIAITAAYVVISRLYIGYVDRQKAVAAYYAGDYLECYSLLYGQDLNESQAKMYHNAEMILKMERVKKNYQTLLMEKKDLEALDYLVQFLYGYEEYRLIGQEWNCLDVVEETHTGMTGLLTANYGLTEAQAMEIAALESDADYTRALMAVLEGTYGQKETADEQSTDVSTYEDLLPEEQEDQDTIFIDTIG